MEINVAEHPINKLINLTSEQLKECINQNNLQISFYAVKKQKNADNYYHAQQLALAEELRLWLIKHIVSQLKLFRGEHNQFLISEYNFEIQKNATLAKFHVQNVEPLVSRFNDLSESLNRQELLDWKQSNFQYIKVLFEEEVFYFAFYRAPKKASQKKKFAIFSSNEWNIKESPDLELGGAIDFFVVGEKIYINNLRHFEYTFDYSDHINIQRDENLNTITSLGLFQGVDSNKEQFMNQCKKYIYSRSLAQISPITLAALEENFEDRCEDLKQIKQKFDDLSEESEKQAMQEQFKEIWPLYDFIDLNNQKIVYNEEQKPTTLIHFFADKIVRSFLTDEFKVALAYE
ncbi:MULTISPECIES: Kiwa anti-phage protein KwaB-like domain-containing protein [Bacillus]|nr:Kiwa anti-phage protein KwaB-like domain-containing protein [Bacillus paranthracis]KXY05904.1 hypothetical protein AT271_09735 [Bacillus cereus]HDR7174634.1 DUF4868 domain-containing protein [Bacillus cereus]HDR7972961.1 DUF4868 domain-containing protein [Bacillus cereus]